MRIKLKGKADIVGLTIKCDTANDGSVGYVDLDVGVDAEKAESWFGADFETLAFATMRMAQSSEEGSDSIVFLQKSIKPGPRIVCEKHVIDIAGHCVSEQPKLLSVEPIDGVARVVAHLRVPFETARPKLVSSLAGHVSQVVDVEFNPEQGVLDLPERPAVEVVKS